jgi:hypothetical protein
MPLPRGNYIVRVDRDLNVGVDSWQVCLTEYEPCSDDHNKVVHQIWLGADGAQWLGTQLLLAGLQSAAAGGSPGVTADEYAARFAEASKAIANFREMLAAASRGLAADNTEAVAK